MGHRHGRLPKRGNVILTGDAAHFKENWDLDHVPGFNFNQEQSHASMNKLKALAEKEHAEVWINHEKTITGPPLFGRAPDWIAHHVMATRSSECNARFTFCGCCFAPILGMGRARDSPNQQAPGLVRASSTGIDALFPAVVDGETRGAHESPADRSPIYLPRRGWQVFCNSTIGRIWPPAIVTR